MLLFLGLDSQVRVSLVRLIIFDLLKSYTLYLMIFDGFLFAVCDDGRIFHGRDRHLSSSFPEAIQQGDFHFDYVCNLVSYRTDDDHTGRRK